MLLDIPHNLVLICVSQVPALQQSLQLHCRQHTLIVIQICNQVVYNVHLCPRLLVLPCALAL